MSADRRDDEYLVELLRSLEEGDAQLEEPPAEVWAGVLAELGDEAPEDAGSPAAPDAPDAPPTITDAGPSGGTTATGAPAPVTPISSRRRVGRPAGWFLAAAAAAVIVLLVLAATVVSRGSEQVELASATLTSAGLPNQNDLQGRAKLVKVGDREELDLDLPGLPEAGDADYELWLLAPDATRLQSLGTTDGRGRYVLPAGTDPRQLPVVDVSREPRDGNPAHSGDSLVRGTLNA